MGYSSRLVSDSFFAAFNGRENELSAVFERCGCGQDCWATLIGKPLGQHAGSPVLEGLSEATCHGRLGERLQGLLREMGQLSSPNGREAIERVCAAHKIPTRGLSNYSGPRLAAWLWLNHARLFEHALDLISAQPMPLHPGALFALPPGLVPDKGAFEAKLKGLFEREGLTGRLAVQEISQGALHEFGVFWEGPAQVTREFGERGLQTRENRPVREAWLRYHGICGDLEIEGGSARERELLWKSFLKAAAGKPRMGEVPSPRVCLDHLISSNFQFQTRPGHSARLSAVRVSGERQRRRFRVEVEDGRNASARDLVLEQTSLRELPGEIPTGSTRSTRSTRSELTVQADPIREKLSVESARIELVLGPGRTGRKVIELSGSEGQGEIRFDRSSNAEQVYGYLRQWRILRYGLASGRAG